MKGLSNHHVSLSSLEVLNSAIDKVQVWMNNQHVGDITQTPNGLCAFEYAPNWLQNGFSISPFDLPLSAGIKIAKRNPFNGGFGVFDDCLPDGWGKILLSRYLLCQGIHFEQLTILQQLCIVGNKGHGALEFRPNRSLPVLHKPANLEQLASEAEAILCDEKYISASLKELLQRGYCSGGACPKVFLKDHAGEWLVKFRSKNHRKDAGLIELNYSKLAFRCGIQMMPCKLFNNHYFGTLRFDRQNGRRLHFFSVAGLLNFDCLDPTMDYGQLLQLAFELTHSEQELWKIYRLMCFNVLIGKKDDHAKNFAFLYDGRWHLAPAYDLVPSNGFHGGIHSMTVNASAVPKKSDLLAIADTFYLSAATAEKIYNEIAYAIKEFGSLHN